MGSADGVEADGGTPSCDVGVGVGAGADVDGTASNAWPREGGALEGTGEDDSGVEPNEKSLSQNVA